MGKVPYKIIVHYNPFILALPRSHPDKSEIYQHVTTFFPYRKLTLSSSRSEAYVLLLLCHLDLINRCHFELISFNINDTEQVN